MLFFEHAGVFLLGYIVLIAPVILGFALGFYNINGALQESCSTYVSSLLHVLIMGMGSFTYTKIIFTGGIFGAIYSFFFYVFALHFLIIIPTGTFIVKFKNTINARGYPQDARQDKEWKVRDYARWVLSWLPNKVLLQLGLLTPRELAGQRRRRLAIEENKATNEEN